MQQQQQQPQHAMYMQTARPPIAYAYPAAPNMGKNVGNGQVFNGQPMYVLNIPQPGQPQPSAQTGYSVQGAQGYSTYPVTQMGGEGKFPQMQRNMQDGSATHIFPGPMVFQQSHMGQPPRQMPGQMPAVRESLSLTM